MKKLLAIVATTAALALVLAVAEPKFLSAYNLQNLARLIAFLGLIALGQGLVIVAGGIDLSVGAVVGLSALLIALLAGSAPLPPGLDGILPGHPIARGVERRAGGRDHDRRGRDPGPDDHASSACSRSSSRSAG